MIIRNGFGPIAPGRNHGHDVLGQELGTDGLAIIPFVHHAMRQGRRGRYLGQHRRKDGALMPVSWGQDEGDAGAGIATARMDFGGPATPRAPQSLCGIPPVFFNAPAAC